MKEFEYLGPYQLGKVLGRGGMGSVYEATHAKSGDRVAVKLIAQHVADDPRFRRRFDAEIETLRRLRHPGIVRLIGYGEESGRLFYAMELVHGESLQQRIRDVKRMNWLPAVDIAIQVTSALKHAHDMGVIHRDLKLANLLLTSSNEVKVVDFGIAKLFGYGDQTLAGSVLGTADYMAPEQAVGGPTTPRTDLYALGSVMYAMLAGRSPFAGKRVTQVMESLKQDRAVPLDLINPDIPREVVEIVHDLLEKDPQNRPPTAIAVNKRLKAIRAGLQRGRTLSVRNEATQNESARDAGSDDHSDTPQSFLTDGLRADEINVAARRGNEHEKMSLDAASSISDASDDFLRHGDERATAATDYAAATGSETEERPQNEQVSSKPEPPTSFQTVDHDEADSGYFGGDAAATLGHHWLQIASFAAMLTILAGGVYLFIRATRVPSADAMFATLQAAAHANELTLNDSLMDRFLVHYPENEHATEVQQWKQQADLDRTMKRLSARARRIGGVANLNPAAQAFLEAMDRRTTSPEKTRENLQAWLDVFTEDGSAKVDATPRLEHAEPLIAMDHLTRLVREELQRLNVQDKNAVVDSRVEMLQTRIKASENMDAAERTKLLRGLIELYGNDPWARSVVDEAAAMLATPADATDPALPNP